MTKDVPKSQERTEGGELPPAEELLPLVYEELRKLAAHKMAQESPGQTLQATSLVHEAWLRIAGSHDRQWHGVQSFVGPVNAQSEFPILFEAILEEMALIPLGRKISFKPENL